MYVSLNFDNSDCNIILLPHWHNFGSTVASFRLDYEYEIEYEYDVSIPGRGSKIVIYPTNIVPLVYFSTGQQQGGTRGLRT